MPFLIHDTYAKRKRAFEPGEPDRVTLYVCGPTVYNYAHIGNARPVVVFDVLFRLLRRLYPEREVVYARNITDVDDRIAQAAIDQGVATAEITDRFAAIYQADMAALNCLQPSAEPRATAHVPQMIDMIARLLRADAAYAAQGHVLFAVDAFADYGALSGRALEDMIAGARVEVAPYKRNPADFVLWKPSKPGEPVWDSPFGPGRPGWHIECSAMIEAVLGLPIDIHGGGHDLIFPHHENEIAQGVCANRGVCANGGVCASDGPYARYWMHNGFLTLDAEKMSKSLGNVLLVHELVKQVPGEVVRWALLSAHYRAPLDWTGELIDQSRRTLDRLYDAWRFLEPFPIDGAGEVHEGVLEALMDDLNTPLALSLFGNYVREVRLNVQNSETARGVAGAAKAVIRATADLLGVLQASPDAWFQGGVEDDLRQRVEALIARRGEARRAKDWAAADTIRAELTEMGVEVLDGAGGAATWRLREG